MKPILLSFLLLMGFTVVYAQKSSLTTVIFVRHAEKANDGSGDPGLSPAGLERAERLRALLAEADVDAVYSTDYKRTRSTVEPLAKHEGLEIRLYHPADRNALKNMIADNKGSTIVVCGHSNTVPAMANELLREAPFGMFDESDYGNLIIVTVGENRESTFVRIRF